MKQLIRFSISGVLGFIITTALFIGMLSLLNDSKPAITGSDTNINFSFVKDFKVPEVKPPNKIEKPVPQEVKQPPAAPVLNMEVNNDPIIKTPIAGTKSSQFNIRDEFSIPGTGGPGVITANNSGGIKAAIAPMYPQAALVNKTEGWVKVQISVNEFGTVSAVNVIDAEPPRTFNAAAKKAVKKWKFHPKTIEGKAVPFEAIQTIEFKIDQ
jgi:protein TonB